jgi:hypothetical protein
MNESRNEPCHCGSGRKYKNCCLWKDKKAAAEAQRASAEPQTEGQPDKSTAQATFLRYARDLDELSNQANDLIRARRWPEAEAACRELHDRFPDEIDGHWRFYECFKAKGDFQSAMPHARATLEMAEKGGGFDPSFPASIKKDIARFEKAIATPTPDN